MEHDQTRARTQIERTEKKTMRDVIYLGELPVDFVPDSDRS